ncbi:MAG: class I SAM-dependent methyltransferase [Acidimicrobiales bacterium]
MDEPSRAAADDDVRLFAFKAWSQYQGFLVSMTMHAGVELGLYDAMVGEGAVTATDRAERTGLDERWVLEWLRVQGAAGLLDHLGSEQFELSAAAAIVLSDPDSLFYAGSPFATLPMRAARIDDLVNGLRTGHGRSYDDHGPAGAEAVEAFFRNWYRHMLTAVMIPGLPGIADKLSGGGRAADIGCGSGVALVELAKAYPKAELHGYEVSPHALDRARGNAASADVDIAFHLVDDEPLPNDASFDLIMTLDCIHDMTDPEPVIDQIRSAIKPDGTWLWAEPRAFATFEENVANNPMAPLMYATSMTACLSSATSAPGGRGYGTLGIHEAEAQRLATNAGFTRFERRDFGSPVNMFYEVGA